MNRSLIFDLATGAFISRREDALFLGPGGAGKSHLAQAIGQAAIQQGYRVLYRETHVLLDELADAVAEGTRKQFMETLTTVPLLIIDDFGMRKLPLTAAEDLLEIVMRRYERASTLLTSNRPVEDWGNCWATWPPSVPCSIACSTMAMCSSAAHAAGAPRPLQPRLKRNPKSWPAAARKFDLPLFRFPLRGQTGAGGFPPRRDTPRANQNRCHASCGGSPHKRAAPPCASPLPSDLHHTRVSS